MNRFIAALAIALLIVFSPFLYIFGTLAHLDFSERCIAHHMYLVEALEDCLWFFSADRATLDEIPQGYVDGRFTDILAEDGSEIVALHTFHMRDVLHVIVDPDGKKLWYIPSYE